MWAMERIVWLIKRIGFYVSSKLSKTGLNMDERNNSEYSDDKILILTGKKCPYCGGKTELIDSAEVYHGVSYGKMYICRPCNAYVGCYKNTDHALGRLANAELRKSKHIAYHYLDQIWKRRLLNRSGTYKMLSEAMGIPKEYTHIGMFDNEQCKQAIEICIAYMKERGKEVVPYNAGDFA